LQLDFKYVVAINEKYAPLNKLIFEGDPSGLVGGVSMESTEGSEEKEVKDYNENIITGLFEKMIMDNESI